MKRRQNNKHNANLNSSNSYNIIKYKFLDVVMHHVFEIRLKEKINLIFFSLLVE